MAKESGLFQKTNDINVYISPELVSDFIYIESEKIYKDVYTVKLYYKIDENKLIEFWKENNFSTKILSDNAMKQIEDLKIAYNNENELNIKKEIELTEKKKQEEKVREKLNQEKIEWINNFGSEQLKLALELNYEHNRLYVQERYKIEFPEFELDYNESSSWKTKVNPSTEALIAVKKLIEDGYEAEIIWLTNPINIEEYDYDNQFESCEAIAIRNYLGKYDLIKIV